jgi:hypothetical protein
MHLGVIGFLPLHSPPFVKVCFTPKHIFDLMGLCTSHLVMNSMLKLWHLMNICSNSPTSLFIYKKCVNIYGVDGLCLGFRVGSRLGCHILWFYIDFKK